MSIFFPAHQTYLGFSWTFQGGVKYFFCFTVLPFGFTSAPYIFTKLLRFLVKLWRFNGVKIVVLIDDRVDQSPFRHCPLFLARCRLYN